MFFKKQVTVVDLNGKVEITIRDDEGELKVVVKLDGAKITYQAGDSEETYERAASEIAQWIWNDLREDVLSFGEDYEAVKRYVLDALLDTGVN